MKVNHLLETNSILSKFISEIRDKNIQKDKMRFRRNIERIGEILGYELSKSLDYSLKEIKTPLGIKKLYIQNDPIVLCSVLRAGLPLHNGLLNYFDDSENGFISAYRKHNEELDNSEIIVEYFASPNLENKVLILADPMLATGQSLISVYKAIKKYGKPKSIHIVSVIGALEGIKLLEEHFPKNTQLWIASLDKKLNKKGYILPGLGDAGDLAFGTKL